MCGNRSWHTYAMHPALPPETGVTLAPPPMRAPLPHSLFPAQSNLPLPVFHLSPCPRVDLGERLLPSIEPVMSSPLLSPLSPLHGRAPLPGARATPGRRLPGAWPSPRVHSPSACRNVLNFV
jgi:hypothetical protein